MGLVVGEMVYIGFFFLVIDLVLIILFLFYDLYYICFFVGEVRYIRGLLFIFFLDISEDCL